MRITIMQGTGKDEATALDQYITVPCMCQQSLVTRNDHQLLFRAIFWHLDRCQEGLHRCLGARAVNANRGQRASGVGSLVKDRRRMGHSLVGWDASDGRAAASAQPPGPLDARACAA